MDIRVFKSRDHHSYSCSECYDKQKRTMDSVPSPPQIPILTIYRVAISSHSIWLCEPCIGALVSGLARAKLNPEDDTL